MFGFLFGTACLIGLIKVVRHGHGYGYGRWGGGHGRHGGGWGPKWMLRSLFERLETTPGQEKVILSEFEAVRAELSKLREEAGKARADIANALRGEHVSQEILTAMYARQDQILESIRRTLSGAIGKVHEALEPGQRKILGDLIERGGYAMGGYGRGSCGGGGWQRRSCGSRSDHGHGGGGDFAANV